MGKSLWRALTLELVLHIEHQRQQNNVISRASLSLVRGLYLISTTHCDVLFLLFKLMNLISYFKTLISHLCYFPLNIILHVSLIISHKSTWIFPNVTLSNVSHLFISLFFGETDGVTFSRLGCTWFAIQMKPVEPIAWGGLHHGGEVHRSWILREF